MPLYVYECRRGHRFEAWQSINDPPLWRCPDHRVTSFIGCHRIIVPTGGHVVDVDGIYQPFSDMRMDPKTKRLGEEKITKRAYEKQDREHREKMMRISKGGPRLDLEPKKQHTWF